MNGEWIMDNMDPNNYDSEWEKCLNDGVLNLLEVEELYEDNTITQEQYEYALDYFNEIAAP